MKIITIYTGLYSASRPGIDPVVLVKYLLVGRIEQEIQVNMAYRWFLGLDLDDRLPDQILYCNVVHLYLYPSTLCQHSITLHVSRSLPIL